MVNIIIINKAGNINELNIRSYDESELYKKCNFKNSENFSNCHTWSKKTNDFSFNTLQVWAKEKGRAGLENKYEFPPPIDNKLYFGSIAIVAFDAESNVCDLTSDEWSKYYTKLFGGFDDLDDNMYDDENETDELDEIPDNCKTKEGYLKDDFIVDSDDSYNSYEGYLFSDED